MKFLITDKKIEYLALEFRKNQRWIDDHLKELKEKYPDTHIAIQKQKVVETNKNYEKLVESLEEKLEETKDIAIEFILAKPMKLLV